MNKNLSRLYRLGNYPISDKLDIFRILVIILEVKLIVHLSPLKYYYSKYVSDEIAEPVDLQPFQGQIRRINRVIKFVPFNLTCLMRAIILRKYLHKLNVNIPIHVGVKVGSEFKAHAWVNADRNNGYIKIN